MTAAEAAMIMMSGGGGGSVVSTNGIFEAADTADALSEKGVGLWKLKLCVIPGSAITPYDLTYQTYIANDSKKYAYLYSAFEYDYAVIALYSGDKLLSVSGVNDSQSNITRYDEIHYSIVNGAPPNGETPIEVKRVKTPIYPLKKASWNLNGISVLCTAEYDCDMVITERDGAGYTTYDYRTSYSATAYCNPGNPYNYANPKYSLEEISSELKGYYNYIAVNGLL